VLIYRAHHRAGRTGNRAAAGRSAGTGEAWTALRARAAARSAPRIRRVCRLSCPGSARARFMRPRTARLAVVGQRLGCGIRPGPCRGWFPVGECPGAGRRLAWQRRTAIAFAARRPAASSRGRRCPGGNGTGGGGRQAARHRRLPSPVISVVQPLLHLDEQEQQAHRGHAERQHQGLSHIHGHYPRALLGYGLGWRAASHPWPPGLARDIKLCPGAARHHLREEPVHDRGAPETSPAALAREPGKRTLRRGAPGVNASAVKNPQQPGGGPAVGGMGAAARLLGAKIGGRAVSSRAVESRRTHSADRRAGGAGSPACQQGGPPGRGPASGGRPAWRTFWSITDPLGPGSSTGLNAVLVGAAPRHGHQPPRVTGRDRRRRTVRPPETYPDAAQEAPLRS
jgi:hypothetical protein